MYKTMLAHDMHHRRAGGDGCAAFGCLTVLFAAGCCAFVFRGESTEDDQSVGSMKDGSDEADADASEDAFGAESTDDTVAASGLYCFLTRSSVRPLSGSPDGSGDEEWVVVDSDAADADTASS